jgi:hypothetical protein
MKSKLHFALLLLVGTTASLCAHYVISTNPTNNVTTISFTNYFFDGVCTLEGKEGRHWVPLQNFFTTQRVGQVQTILPTNYSAFRFKCLDVSPGNAFTHLPASYGSIHTIAGVAVPSETNVWQEGALATDVVLSDPRAAAADSAGNIYVVERGAHAVDRITPDGRIATFVGLRYPTNTDVLGTGAPQPRTAFGLRSPSGLFLSGAILYVLDAGNNRIVTVDLTFGSASGPNFDFTPGGMGPDAEGLWAQVDNKGFVEAFFGSGTTVKHLKENVITVAGTGFVHVSDVKVDLAGRTIVADSADNRVYRLRSTGRKEAVAGTGFLVGPGSGKVKKVALPGASSIAFLPIGGYVVSLDEGARIYYVDANDEAAPIAFGAPGAHTGDGEWFRAHGRRPKFSNLLNITLAPNGDLIFVEREGILRKIDFLRHRP